MKKYIRFIVICTFIAIISIGAFSSNALAVNEYDENKDISLTINYRYEGEALSGVKFNIYKVGNIDYDYNIYKTSEFMNYPFDFKSSEHDIWNEYALALTGYVQKDDMIPILSANTNRDGILKVNLKSGLYLVVGEKYTKDENIYKTAPYLICLPKLDRKTGLWRYEVTSKPKADRNKSKEKIEKKIFKIWKDHGYEDLRPEKIEIELLKDRKSYKVITLDKSNNRRHTLKDQDSDSDRTAIERLENEKNYNTKIREDKDSIIIENIYINEGDNEDSKTPISPDNEKDNSLPQTGQLWYPVYLLIGIGIMFMVMGYIKEKVRDLKNDEINSSN